MNSINAIFDSRDNRFRSPAGAVRSGSKITLTLLIPCSVKVLKAELVVCNDRDLHTVRHLMEPVPDKTAIHEYAAYRAVVIPKEKGLYWYHFEVTTDLGFHVISRMEGHNYATEQENMIPWQQTVYDPMYDEPSWINGGVYYQIFVDRFNHAGKNVELPGKTLRSDWGGCPEWQPVDGKVLNNDFFGGNLRGIIEKLPYLEDLGVTCLYLSPIFEAVSNHKYDTSNYFNIDPMFGTEDDFEELCSKANKKGIRIILDGVFAHTGDDSLYFDRYGHYGGKGAYTDPGSKYRNWYRFHEDGSYDSWWGIDTLPQTNMLDDTYMQFLTGKDGVLRHWLRKGASGWRLDVVDEYPSGAVGKVAKAVKAEKPDALLIGEVWEDASNKIAYQERKNYFDGSRLDSVMNYPMKDAIIDFVRNGNALRVARQMEAIMAHYPEFAVHSLMNILGTHDSIRILTALAGQIPDPDATREELSRLHMTEEERQRGIRRLKIAVALQMTLPGVPCIYYGDETGMEGYKDPFNRRCYPWGKEDTDLQAWYKRIIKIRREHRSVYAVGGYRTTAAHNGLYAFERFSEDPRVHSIITAANCGTNAVRLRLHGHWTNMLNGEVIKDNTTVLPGEVLLLEHGFGM